MDVRDTKKENGRDKYEKKIRIKIRTQDRKDNDGRVEGRHWLPSLHDLLLESMQKSRFIFLLLVCHCVRIFYDFGRLFSLKIVNF